MPSKFWQRMASEKRQFDLVIIDPPMFAQNQSQTAAAISAYQRLTRLGLGVLRPGGVLVQASCSSRVEAEAFFNAIHQAARDSNRQSDRNRTDRSRPGSSDWV